ncbi:MAG: LacI family DNA-binding transcriptional regulator [Anaerolineales bacterium]
MRSASNTQTRSHPTIRDVAKQAGVSRQTVSRVINGDNRVAPATRTQVEGVITEMGYRPNVIARSMSRGRAHTLACLAPNLSDYTFARIIEGAEAEARKHGYFLLSSSAPDAEAFAALIEQLVMHRRVDAVMVINPYIDQRFEHLAEAEPAVFIGARSRDIGFSSVSLDEQRAARVATQHLLELGHQDIAMIHGPLAEESAQERWDGCRATLRDAGVEADSAWVAEGDWSASSGYAAMRKLLATDKDFTALFAHNDRMAVGAISALHEAGRRVPDDVSVIGFDDIPLASYFDPPLTTMRQDTWEIGEVAVRQLIAALEDEAAQPEHIALPAELIVRQSTRRLA